MIYLQKVILFFIIMFVIIGSHAADSTNVTPFDHPTVMHQTSKVNVKSIDYKTITYTSDGDQVAPMCNPNSSLVHVDNTAKQVYWGPPKSVCIRRGNCSGFGCYCSGSPHKCCGWCEVPCKEYSQVKWETRPDKNQDKAIYENMPSVLSHVGCAPVETVWEKV